MVTFRSRGGALPSPAEDGRSMLGAVTIFALIMASLVYLGIRAGKDDAAPSEPAVAVSCREILPGSVFTTGDPLIDERILYVIASDKSEVRQVAGGIVEHIWKNGNFSFPKREENALWEKATSVVTRPRADAPLLAVTESSLIVPYAPTPQTKDLKWAFARADKPSSEPSIFLVGGDKGGTKTTFVPTVLRSINGGQVIFSPTLGEGTTTVIAGAAKVCS